MLLLTAGDNPERSAVRSQLRIAVLRQPGSGIVGKKRSATGSTAAEIAPPTAHYTSSPSGAYGPISEPRIRRSSTAEGHSNRDAIRALKRYLAREVFTLITQRRKEINATRIAA